MSTIKTIPVERLSGLDVHEGDTLHILSVKESAFVVQISRADEEEDVLKGKAGTWLRDAKGSVRHSATETVDDLRMEYYASKHGLKQ